MMARSGRRTVPQIFIGETHVGGCDDLHALEASGRLDTLLKTGVEMANETAGGVPAPGCAGRNGPGAGSAECLSEGLLV